MVVNSWIFQNMFFSVLQGSQWSVVHGKKKYALGISPKPKQEPHSLVVNFIQSWKQTLRESHDARRPRFESEFVEGFDGVCMKGFFSEDSWELREFYD